MAWLAGWTYRKAIVIAHTDDGAQTDYQLKLLVGESSGAAGEDVACGGNVASDFDDLRFTAADGSTVLDYWIESLTGATPNGLATVWVEVPSIAAHPTDTTIYMYYGGTQTAVTSGANTFILFDDFERGNDGDTIGGAWTEVTAHVHISTEQDIGNVAGFTGTRAAKLVGGTSPQATIPHVAGNGYAIRFRLYKENAPEVIPLSHGNGTNRMALYATTSEDIKYYTGSAWVDTGVNITPDAWTLFEVNDISFATPDYDIWYEGSEIKANAAMQNDASTTNVIRILGDATATEDSWIDDFIVRKWTANEPTWGSFGAAQVSISSGVLIGELVGATRIANYPKTAAVAIGELVGATVVRGYVVASAVLVGVTVGATRTASFFRTAPVYIGELVGATRTLAITKTSAVAIGVAVAATRVRNVIRTAAVAIGMAVSAVITYLWLIRFLINHGIYRMFAEVMTNYRTFKESHAWHRMFLDSNSDYRTFKEQSASYRNFTEVE